MTTDANSRSPEPAELLDLAIRHHLIDVNVALPGRIESYDAAEQKAEVKPLIRRLLAAEDGSEVEEELPVIPAVPVVFPRGGKFFISMPVQKGDFCLLIFNSFPIDKYKAGTGKDQSPDDFDTHQLESAVALMGFAPFAKAISEADADNLVLGMESGPQVHISDSKVELGQKGAGEKVSIDSKIQQELQKISTQINAIGTDLTLLATHGHTGNMGMPTSQPLPPPSGGQSYNPSDTASTLVTIKE